MGSWGKASARSKFYSPERLVERAWVIWLLKNWLHIIARSSGFIGGFCFQFSSRGAIALYRAQTFRWLQCRQLLLAMYCLMGKLWVWVCWAVMFYTFIIACRVWNWNCLVRRSLLLLCHIASVMSL